MSSSKKTSVWGTNWRKLVKRISFLTLALSSTRKRGRSRWTGSCKGVDTRALSMERACRPWMEGRRSRWHMKIWADRASLVRRANKGRPKSSETHRKGDLKIHWEITSSLLICCKSVIRTYIQANPLYLQPFNSNIKRAKKHSTLSTKSSKLTKLETQTRTLLTTN